MKQSKQIDKRKTGLVRIDADWLYHAKLEAVRRRTTVKSIVEESLELAIGNYPSLNADQRTNHEPHK